MSKSAYQWVCLETGVVLSKQKALIAKKDETHRSADSTDAGFLLTVN